MRTAVAIAFLAAAPVLPAQALEPTQLFDKVSPSVWIVRTYDAAERPIGLGSAVVIESGRLVTNCHVLAKAKEVFVRRDNVMYEAKLEHADAPRDLCVLQVAHFSAPAVTVRSVKDLKVGERVYAIGNPKGLEVTLSEGLVSGLRALHDSADKDDDTLVQTSAPLSPGSSGGGLFDTEGRLVGITTFGWRDAQNLNVAVPSDWIAQVPERAQLALAKRNAPKTTASGSAAPVAPGYPAPGTVWVYGFTDRIFNRRKVDVTVRVLRIDDTELEETVTADAPGAADMRRVINTRALRFLEYPISSSNALLELAPYLLAASDGKAPADVPSPTGYPVGGGGLPGWKATAQVKDWTQVTVPAGTFRALRVEVSGRRIGGYTTRTSAAGRFKMTLWYSPDVKRIVRIEHRVWSADAFASTQTGEDVVELLSYRPPS